MDTRFVLFMVGLWAVWQVNQTLKIFTLFPRYVPCESKMMANDPDRFLGFNNSLERGVSDELLVPNVIHFIRMGEKSAVVRPEEAACINAALRTQADCSVVVHTDQPGLEGAAWQSLLRHRSWSGRLRVQRRRRPLHVFGLPLRDEAAVQRVTMLRVLMKYGGTYVSSSAYLQGDLTPYRRYEAAAASLPSSETPEPEVVAAHRDARLLRRWLHLFHDAALEWQRRPPDPDHLRRAIAADAGATSPPLLRELHAVKDPTKEEILDRQDWFLWSGEAVFRNYADSWLENQ